MVLAFVDGKGLVYSNIVPGAKQLTLTLSRPRHHPETAEEEASTGSGRVVLPLGQSSGLFHCLYP